MLHCEDSYFSVLTVWNTCYSDTEKSWHIQNKHYLTMMQLEDWRSMLFLKNSSNQASKSIDEFLMNILGFLCIGNIENIDPWFFPFSLLLIPRWRLVNWPYRSIFTCQSTDNLFNLPTQTYKTAGKSQKCQTDLIFKIFFFPP